MPNIFIEAPRPSMSRVVPKVGSWGRAVAVIAPRRLPLRYQLKILISLNFLVLLLFLFPKPLLLWGQHRILELGVQHLGGVVERRRWRRWPTVPHCVFGNAHLTFLVWRFEQVQVRDRSFWSLLAPFLHVFAIFNGIWECTNSFAILFLSLSFNLGHN